MSGHTDDGVFDYFPKISDQFRKIIQNCSEGQTNAPEHFPKISEDCRRISGKTRRCFDHTSTNLSTIYETRLISVKSSISSLVRIWKICHLSPGCSFMGFSYTWWQGKSERCDWFFLGQDFAIRNGHWLCIFCFRKPANSKQAWSEYHIINYLLT